jgi:hypothetical protein
MKRVLVIVGLLVGSLAFAWWWRRSKKPLVLSVAGGDVIVSNVEAIEERQVWEYTGLERWFAWTQPNPYYQNLDSHGVTRFPEGSFWDKLPALPGWRCVPDLTREGRLARRFGVQRVHLDADEWRGQFRPKIMTVGEAAYQGVLTTPVPETYE